MSDPKPIRLSFPDQQGSPVRVALYGTPCDPPPWREGVPSASGEWHTLALSRDREPAGVYLRRYREGRIKSTFSGRHSVHIAKIQVTRWAVVTEARGFVFETRAEALRHARKLLEVER